MDGLLRRAGPLHQPPVARSPDNSDCFGFHRRQVRGVDRFVDAAHKKTQSHRQRTPARSACTKGESAMSAMTISAAEPDVSTLAEQSTNKLLEIDAETFRACFNQ